MPPTDERPHLFCLHFLGGSARSWQQVADRLGAIVRCVQFDLAGFGAAADQPGYAVTEMADAVAASVRAHAPQRWFVAGHSMGAKVAAVLARRAEDGAEGLGGLAGLALVAGSPPAPEPMPDDKRQTMLGWFAADGDANQKQAYDYITKGVTTPLADTDHADAAADVLRANPAAWQAWLHSGSREDWSGRIGLLHTPALVIAGADDSDLGPEAQQRLMTRHFATVRLETIADAGHLLPMEQPQKVADLIGDWLNATVPQPVVGQAYRALIASDRVSRNTRELLLARTRPDSPDYQPRVLTPAELATLRALLGRVLPQAGPAIDLAARIDEVLQGEGDGWRFAELPPDADAYRAGLQALDSLSFPTLDAAAQDALLEAAAAGDLSATSGLNGAQMKLWFEDVRADAVRIYMAHPATLARIGYSGIGYGGDGEPKPGFHQVGPGEREPWEPAPQEQPA